MNKETLEQISSLMDGELSEETGLFLTRRMGSDHGLSVAWERYHLIRDCLRQPGTKWAVCGMSLDLDRAVSEADPAPEALAGPGREVPGWLRVASGSAIAASVAAVALLLAMPRPEATGAMALQSQPKPFSSPNVLAAGPVSQPASFAGQDRASHQRLNSYLLRHNQAAGAVGPQGFVSFMPIVTTRPVAVVRETDISPTAIPDPAADSRTDR